MAEDEKSLEEEELSENKGAQEEVEDSGEVEEIIELDSDDFPGIRKKAYQENENQSISQERDRLKELLDQTEISSGEEDKKIRTENLERIANAPPVSSITSGGQDTAYEESSTPYVENNVYQASSAYQSKNYEEMKHPTNEASQMQDPKTPQAYTPKPVENFEEQKKTSFAMGSEHEKEQAKGKYRLR